MNLLPDWIESVPKKTSELFENNSNIVSITKKVKRDNTIMKKLARNNEFEKNSCAGSVFNGITILIDLIDNNPDTFNVLTLRSFGESFYHHITDAALEFGYVGI